MTEASDLVGEFPDLPVHRVGIADEQDAARGGLLSVATDEGGGVLAGRHDGLAARAGVRSGRGAVDLRRELRRNGAGQELRILRGRLEARVEEPQELAAHTNAFFVGVA